MLPYRHRGHAASCGEDAWTTRAADAVRAMFACDCEVFLVFAAAVTKVPGVAPVEANAVFLKPDADVSACAAASERCIGERSLAAGVGRVPQLIPS